MIKKNINQILLNWSVSQVNLEFVIADNETLVTSHLICKKINKNALDMELLGKNIDLLEICVDGQKIDYQNYKINTNQLVIKNLTKNSYVITIKSKISFISTRRTGLFLADKKIFTVNDKDSFYRITYFFDDNDAYVRFSCKITAAKDKFPHLLSDGEVVDKGENKNTHWVLWQSSCLRAPHQFSLVAGNFAVVKTKLTLGSKDVEVVFYVPEIYKDHCNYALNCISKILQFDYGLLQTTYYPSSYKIVALKNYKERIMEGKELNIFDITSIASSTNTTTDLEYVEIDKKLAKKFFYICYREKSIKQNWFYYAFCQSFSVFRLQEYLFHKYGKSFQEIEYAKEYLKLLHTNGGESLAPIQFFDNSHDYSQNYHRMVKILQMLSLSFDKAIFFATLGEYLNQCKKKEAVLENFISFIQSAGRKKLKNFHIWFIEKQIPQITVLDYYNESQRTYKIFFFQVDQNKITKSGSEYWNQFLQNNKDKNSYKFTTSIEDLKTEKLEFHKIIAKLPLVEQAFPINFNVALQYRNSEDIISDTERNKRPKIVELRKNYHSFTYYDTPNLLPSFNHGFITPVDIKYQYSHNELANLSYNEGNSYICWQANRVFFLSIFEEQLARYAKDKVVYTNDSFIINFQKIITNNFFNNTLIYQSMNLPTEEELFFDVSQKNTDSIHYIRNYLLESLSSKLLSNFLNLYQKNTSEFEFSLDSKEIFKRMIRNTCLLYIAYSEEKNLIINQFKNSNHFNDIMGAMRALNNIDCEEREQVMSETAKKWQKNQFLLAKWFQLQASSNRPGVMSAIEQIAQHSLLNYKKPRLITSFFYTFIFCNFYCFHHISGRGYELVKNFIIEIDKINNDIACDLVVSFKSEPNFSPIKENNKKECLENILSQKISRKLNKIAKNLLVDD